MRPVVVAMTVALVAVITIVIATRMTVSPTTTHMTAMSLTAPAALGALVTVVHSAVVVLTSVGADAILTMAISAAGRYID